MNAKVLFVDDDPRILHGIRRQIDQQFDFDLACGPEEALRLVAQSMPYAVVVSDMRMPGMNGIELLSRLRKASPDTVRVMLTGFADLSTTIKAVNEGNVFRFLAKPCSQETLAAAVKDGIRQYELVIGERELVEGTLKGSVQVLSEVLGLINPVAFGRAARVQRIVLHLARALHVENAWELEIAAMLHPLGMVTIPDEMLQKVADGNALTCEERLVYDQHARTASRLLRNIPRLESVADIIAGQNGVPNCAKHSSSVDMGLRILRIALDYDTAISTSRDSLQAMDSVRQNAEFYGSDVVCAMNALVDNQTGQSIADVTVARLREGMILAKDIRDVSGKLLVAKGHEVTSSLKKRLQNYSLSGRLQEIIQIEVSSSVTAELVPSSFT